MYKSFKEIGLNITEEQYRNDGAMHYSTLATYSRGGFGSIETLKEKKESPSLTFGSAVDSIITGGKKEFEERFIVADFPVLEPAYTNILTALYKLYGESYTRLSDIPEANVIAMTESIGFYRNWKPETRVKVIREKGEDYYNLLSISDDKVILDTATYNDVIKSVEALKTSDATKDLFEEDNPFDDTIERIYQMKFSGYITDRDDTVVALNNFIVNEGNLEELDRAGYTRFSCMADLIKVDHAKKIVYPCDLKTSSHKEYDFFKSFVDWSYHIQARLYWRLIRAAMDADEVFKDYELADYTFIVVNRATLTPMTWLYRDTQSSGTLTYGKNRTIECRDPFELGRELSYYLSTNSKFPAGISDKSPNDLLFWLNTL